MQSNANDTTVDLVFKEVNTANGLFCQFDEQFGVLLLDIKNPFTSDDFKTISALIDPYFAKKGELRGVILNSKKFPHWVNFQNRQEYLEFASNNHHKFKRAALGMGGFFIKILVLMAKGRVHPKVKTFKFNQIEDAQDWVLYGK